MGNLFSSFDPQARIFLFRGAFNWISIMSALVFLPQMFWVSSNQIKKLTAEVISALMNELKAVFSRALTPGSMIIFVAFFIYILLSNFLGLFPYVFTASRHLVFTLALSLPVWLGTIIWSIIFQFKRIMAHLVPLGTPVALMPVMVLIETVRSVIRPLTLGIRLAANIIAGHLLLTLLGGQGRFNLALVVVMVALVTLLILECAVACIQSYVFTILRSLYLNELVSVRFSKKFI